MGLSRSTLRVIAGGIYKMLLSSRPPSLSLGVYSLFSRIHISSHGYTIVVIPAYLFPLISLFRDVDQRSRLVVSGETRYVVLN